MGFATRSAKRREASPRLLGKPQLFDGLNHRFAREARTKKGFLRLASRVAHASHDARETLRRLGVGVARQRSHERGVGRVGEPLEEPEKRRVLRADRFVLGERTANGPSFLDAPLEKDALKEFRKLGRVARTLNVAAGACL